MYWSRFDLQLDFSDLCYPVKQRNKKLKNSQVLFNNVPKVQFRCKKKKKNNKLINKKKVFPLREKVKYF